MSLGLSACGTDLDHFSGGDPINFSIREQNLSGETALTAEDIAAATIRLYVVAETAMGTNPALPTETYGSGFFISPEHIVTNNHVIAGATSIEVWHANGDRETAEVLGSSECADLAVLKTARSSEDRKSLNFSTLEALLGMEVSSSGYPIQSGGEYAFVAGNVTSEISRFDLRFASVPRGFFHSAVAGLGNSGGPVIGNENKRVAGVTFAGVVGQDDRILAIDGLYAQWIVAHLLESKNDYAKSLGILAYASLGAPEFGPGGKGIHIEAVTENSRAARMQLKAGDRLLEFHDVNLVAHSQNLRRYCDTLQNTNWDAAPRFKIERWENGESRICTGQWGGAIECGDEN